MAKIIDHSDQLLAEVNRRIDQALEESAKVVEDKIEEICPVKTGATRDSRDHEVFDKTATIGVKTPYAPYLEQRKPFLRPALHSSLSRIKKVFNSKGLR